MKASFTDRCISSALALTANTRVGNALEQFFINRFEASTFNPDRSWIPQFFQDARNDENSWSRAEICRKMRYFDENNWLIASMKQEYIKWTIGPDGMQIQPASSDEEWNKSHLEAYQEWCVSPCLDSTISMPDVHEQIAGNHWLESEIFTLLTRSNDSGRQSRPKIQLLESHRCNSGIESNDGTQNQIDGVQLGKDATGRVVAPIGYYFRDGVFGDTVAFRSVADVLHLFDSRRPGSYRGLSRFAPALNTLHDFDDLEIMEMQRAKLNSEVANIITNAPGELSPDMQGMKKFPFGRNTQTGNNPASDNELKRASMLKKILGSRTIALRTGEKFEQVSQESPSAASQWYWRYKIGQLCGIGMVPMILVFPEMIESIQGTVVRGIYDNAHATFRRQHRKYANNALAMYLYFTKWAIYNDKRSIDAPGDWMNAHIVPPPAVNVDIGYNAAATIAELQAGTTNLGEIFGRKGRTREWGIRERIKDVQMTKQLCVEMSKESGIEVSPEEVSGSIAEALQTMAETQQASATAENMGEDDEDETPQPAGKSKGKK